MRYFIAGVLIGMVIGSYLTFWRHQVVSRRTHVERLDGLTRLMAKPTHGELHIMQKPACKLCDERAERERNGIFEGDE